MRQGFWQSKKIWGFSLLILMIVAFLGWGRIHRVGADIDSTYEKLKVLADVLAIVEKNYVEPVNVGKDFCSAKILDAFIFSFPPRTPRWIHLARVWASHSIGSSGLPRWRISKYRQGPRREPVSPTKATGSPARTSSPTFFSRAEAWPERV